MRLFKFAVPALILAGGVTMCTVSSYGKAEYTKATKKACVTCHTAKAPKDGKDLNEVGKCYGKKKSLDGCTAAQ